MTNMIIGAILGVIAIVIGLYLLKRNSPKHYAQAQDAIDKAGDTVGEVYKDVSDKMRGK